MFLTNYYSPGVRAECSANVLTTFHQTVARSIPGTNYLKFCSAICSPSLFCLLHAGGQDDDTTATQAFPSSAYNASETLVPNFAEHDDNSNHSSAVGSTHSNYDALLEGDHLISQPRKVMQFNGLFRGSHCASSSRLFV